MTNPAPNFVSAVAALIDGPVSEERAVLHRASASIRKLTDLLIDRDLTVDQLEAVLRDVSAVTANLETASRRNYLDTFQGAHGFIDFSPVAGMANPIAPPLELRVDDDCIRGEVTFRSVHEGPPGHVHGGILAAAFDDVLGMTQALPGSPGMTGRLTIHYRRPTPLRTPVRFVGRVLNVSGRKISTVAESLVEVDGEWVVTAECEGLFISIPRERFESMAGGAS